LATARHAVKNIPSDIFLLVSPNAFADKGYVHDGRLVDGSDLVSASLGSVVESITSDSLRCLVGDEFDGLNNTVDKLECQAGTLRTMSVNTHLVLDTRVLSLGVLSDKNGVDVVVSGLVSLDGDTWSDVGKEGECSS
jgi:hypothetical protein